STRACPARPSTPSPPGTRWAWARRTTWSAPTRTWPATPRAGRPARRWSSTAGTPRPDPRGATARPELPAGDPPHEDLAERLADVAGRQAAAGPQPQVGVVVHAEPGPGGQPGVEVAELAGPHAGLEHR